MTGYDGYDDYEPYESTAAGGYETYAEQPAYGTVPGAHARYDIESLLQMATEMVQQAKAMPLSASVLVSREELLNILDNAQRVLPEEIREARWALRDREELMAAEIRKAEQLMDRVRAEAARMVDKTEIVRQARVAADQIVSEAQERARTLINEAEDYCDQKLGGMEIVLDRLTKTVRSGRERLRPSVAPVDEPVYDASSETAAYRDGVSAREVVSYREPAPTYASPSPAYVASSAVRSEPSYASSSYDAPAYEAPAYDDGASDESAFFDQDLL